MRSLSLRQFRTLVAIKRAGRISAAARDLGLTSPAATLQIQQMEAELGLTLFHRTRTGVVATEAGEAAIETALRIERELALLGEQIEALKGVSAGLIRLGVVSTGKYFTPRIMAAFSAAYPGIDMTLLAANRSEIIQKLRDHEIDVALMGRPPRDLQVHTTFFGDHPLVFIASPNHPLAHEIDISKDQLSQHRFIVREQGSGTRSSFEFFMGDVPGGLKQSPTEMDSNETIKQAVMAGLGIAFISGHTIETECEAGRLIILDVAGTPIRRQWFAVSNARRTGSPATEALMTFLRTKGASLLPVVSKTYPELATTLPANEEGDGPASI